MRRTAITGLALILAGALAAPAGGQVISVTRPRNDALAKLEKNRDANPNSVSALRQLGIAYYKLDRYQDAKNVLDQSRRLDPKDGLSALYAGLAAEQLKDMPGAKDAYTSYLAVGKTRGVRNQIRARLIALSKEELKSAAKAAVANEVQLAQQPGPPNTIAVLPFTILSSDSTLAPLSRGLADLVITDLAKASAVRIVERDRMQAISDEIRLSQSAQVDQATAVRAGKLIQAGRVLNSNLLPTGGASMTINGLLASTQSAQVANVAPSNGSIEQLFQMETNYVLDILLNQLRVTLTAAERQAIQQKPTLNIQAFMAYSRGLMAEDNGRLDEAGRYYENARTLDPGFGAALQRAQAAAQAQQGQQVSGATVEQGLKNSAEGQQVSAAERGSSGAGSNTGTLSAAAGDVNPSLATTVAQGTTGSAPTGPRPATAETSGTAEPVQRTGTVTILIRRP